MKLAWVSAARNRRKSNNSCAGVPWHSFEDVGIESLELESQEAHEDTEKAWWLGGGGRGMALELVTLWKAWADLRVRPAEEGKRAALTRWTSSKDIRWIWRHRCFSSGISFVVVCPCVLGNCWLVMVTALHVTILWGNLEGYLLRKVLWIVASHSLGNYWKPDSFFIENQILAPAMQQSYFRWLTTFCANWLYSSKWGLGCWVLPYLLGSDFSGHIRDWKTTRENVGGILIILENLDFPDSVLKQWVFFINQVNWKIHMTI